MSTNWITYFIIQNFYEFLIDLVCGFRTIKKNAVCSENKKNESVNTFPAKFLLQQCSKYSQ